MTRYAALVLILLVTLSARATGVTTPAQDDEVRRVTTLVLTTFYRKVDPAKILSAERSELAVYVAKSKHNVALPPLPANLSASSAADLAVDLFHAATRAGADSSAAETIALKAIAGAAHDRYTEFLTRSEYGAISEILTPAKLSGIGILMDIDPSSKDIRAFFVVPNTPADRAGMKSGDLLASVNGLSTRGWTIAQARQHLLGKAGTKVVIGMSRPSEKLTNELTLVREEVRPPTVYFNMLDDHVAYVFIAAFGSATADEFHTAVQRSEAAGARGYVVDVRNDGGGIVGSALSVASEFVPSGPLVSIESNGGQIETFDADDDAIAPKPLAVLVNSYTASASEIMAAAISESRTGTLVGTKTFGKGVVQSVTSFPDGSAVKITTGRYYTPLNHDINGRGIVPDIVVSENDHAVFGMPSKDAQLSRALLVVEGGGNERS